MSAILTILRRELGAYFNTPIGYVFMVMFLVLSCWLYVLTLFGEGVAEMRGYFGILPLLFLIFIPAISMRLWAEERKLGTLELLMSMPVRTWQAVLAKFMAGMLFLAITMALTLQLPLALVLLSPAGGPGPDFGPIIGGYLGAVVLGMVYLSIGAFASSLTRDQIVAFVVGISICFFFFLLSYEPFLSTIRDLRYGAVLAANLERFGVNFHFESIARGVVDTRDVLYAFSISGFFLFLNVVVIERRR